MQTQIRSAIGCVSSSSVQNKIKEISRLIQDELKLKSQPSWDMISLLQALFTLFKNRLPQVQAIEWIRIKIYLKSLSKILNKSDSSLQVIDRNLIIQSKRILENLSHKTTNKSVPLYNTIYSLIQDLIKLYGNHRHISKLHINEWHVDESPEPSQINVVQMQQGFSDENKINFQALLHQIRLQEDATYEKKINSPMKVGRVNTFHTPKSQKWDYLDQYSSEKISLHSQINSDNKIKSLIQQQASALKWQIDREVQFIDQFQARQSVVSVSFHQVQKDLEWDYSQAQKSNLQQEKKKQCSRLARFKSYEFRREIYNTKTESDGHQEQRDEDEALNQLRYKAKLCKQQQEEQQQNLNFLKTLIQNKPKRIG